MDPRFFMADVIKAYKGKQDELNKFWDEINNCQSPDDAIGICLKYLAAASASA